MCFHEKNNDLKNTRESTAIVLAKKYRKNQKIDFFRTDMKYSSLFRRPFNSNANINMKESSCYEF